MEGRKGTDKKEIGRDWDSREVISNCTGECFYECLVSGKNTT